MEPSPAAAAAARRSGESGAGGTLEPSPSAATATDLLSSLPAHLQDEILIRLDLRDAVRTSALSRAWRHFWKSLSVVSLSFPHPSVVDSVLPRYTGPRISRFAVYVDEASAGRIDDWVVALSRYSVDSIDIYGLLESGHFNLHSSIFSCDHLVSLELSRCNIPPLPVGFAGFPVLQVLILGSVEFPANGENQLEAIIRHSPLLHDLTLFAVTIPKDCPDSVIQTPNLRKLAIFSGNDKGWRIGEMPRLEYAKIEVMLYRQHGHDFGGFLAQFAHVRKLALFWPINDVEIMHKLPFNFYNLKDLKLSTHFTQMEPILFIFTLLRSCHNLEKLKIEILLEDDQDIEANLEFLNTQWTDGVCANLQVVQMIDINRLPNEISFMKLILSKAKLLRTLYVDVQPYSLDDPLLEILKCRRASAQAHVLFQGLAQQY
ncbi:hypothetical protein BS78_09G236600 [Paspalum vaginatum]|nr:hypothetical protein BS78_09G236600 [Paspalum vaginatum]